MCVADKIAKAATVLSGSGMKHVMHVQTSLTKRGPPNPWLTVYTCVPTPPTHVCGGGGGVNFD